MSDSEQHSDHLVCFQCLLRSLFEETSPYRLSLCILWHTIPAPAILTSSVSAGAMADASRFASASFHCDWLAFGEDDEGDGLSSMTYGADDANAM